MPWWSRRLTPYLLLGLAGTSASYGPADSAWATQLQPIELELVLAMDASLSVKDFEFELQKLGLANAFRHPDVVKAIEACGDQAIGVTVVQWSDNRMHLTSVDWTIIHDEGSAARFASAIEAVPRVLRGFTGIGGAIRFSLKKIEENQYDGRRKVIDVSSDGRSTGLSPKLERDRAIRRGATINGLAIIDEEPDLDEYYADHVIGGRGAFVMAVRRFEDFADAIRAKLQSEITCSTVVTQAK